MDIHNEKTARQYLLEWQHNPNIVRRLASLLHDLDNTKGVLESYREEGSQRYLDLSEAIGVLKVGYFKLTGRAWVRSSTYTTDSYGRSYPVYENR